MTDHKGLPVSGYQPQSDAKVALVNEFKADEERLLRKLDTLNKARKTVFVGSGAFGAIFDAPQQGYEHRTDEPLYDQRWIAVARSHFEQGYMALNRSVFQPGRVKLPEDE